MGRRPAWHGKRCQAVRRRRISLWRRAWRSQETQHRHTSVFYAPNRNPVNGYEKGKYPETLEELTTQYWRHAVADRRVLEETAQAEQLYLRRFFDWFGPRIRRSGSLRPSIPIC